MHYRKKISALCICCILLGSLMFTGCIPVKKPNEEKKVEETEKEESDKKEKEEKDNDKVIVAGSVDTSSKYSFTVEEALIGLSYDDEPIVVLVASFTNDSDEDISFSWALDVSAKQGGFTLSTAYLPGTREFNYNEIEPGSTIPIFIGWEIADAESDITLTVVDSRHYAKEEIYSKSFTIEELIKNTENYQGAEDIIEKSL